MRSLMPGRRFVAVGATALLLSAAAACGDDEDALTACTDAPYPPFEFEDEDGEFTGFDMELLREIATRLDREFDVTVQPFDGILLKPQAGDCDIVASAVTITEERAEQVLFSDPYFDADQSLLVLAENEEEFATLEDLAGETIGVQTDTTGAIYAEDNLPEGAETSEFDDAAAMFLGLESGDVAALLQDFPVNAYRALQDDSMVVTETFQTDEEYGFAVADDNQDLIDDVNEQLEAIRDDGTYDELYEEWFGEAPS